MDLNTLLLLLLLLATGVIWAICLRMARRNAIMRQHEALTRTILDNLPFGVAVNTVSPEVRFDYMNDRFAELYRTTREALAKPDGFWNAAYEDATVRENVRRRVELDCASGDPARMCWENIPITRRGEKTSYISAQNIPVADRTLMISLVWEVTDHMRNERHIRHLNRVLMAVRDVNQLIVRERNPRKLIEEACRLLVVYRGFSSALILLTGEGDTPTQWTGAGEIEHSALIEDMVARGELPDCCHHARESGNLFIVESRETICTNCPLAVADTTTHSLTVRMVHEGIPFGYVMAAVDREFKIDDDERNLMIELADDLAYALHGIRVAQQRQAAETERKSLSDQLAQAQKLEAVGRLAGGVAHDFNNLLMGILGYADLCRTGLPPNHPAREWLDDITDGAQRSADLTRQLLAFARKQTIAPQILDLNTTLEAMLKLLRHLLGEDIDLVWQPGREVWPVKIDPSQLDQILANLCVNARDAIQGVGKLTIETMNRTIDRDYCDDHPEALMGDFALLAVSDNGCGMTHDVLEHIFEPFFTTKPMGAGTGLGLATVYGIVKQNLGFVNVYSEPGKGTAFRIYLPRAEGATPESPDRRKPPVPDPGGSETLLLVEDEAGIRKAVEKLLSLLGYRLLVAADPAEALQLAEQHPEPIALLLTDVVMPGMSGKELAKRLTALRPTLKCLFMSGYTASVIAHHGVLEEGVNFIQKPIAMHDLALRIRAILDATD